MPIPTPSPGNLPVTYQMLILLLGPAATVLGAVLKTLYDHYKHKRQLYVDDGTQLRKDLLEERKTLLNQILSDRQFYTDKVNNLERRVAHLEDENRSKDEKILAQQAQINDQESLIHTLQSEYGSKTPN